MNEWVEIEKRILGNDGVSRDNTGKLQCSDLVENIIKKCDFKYRYWVTFTHPQTTVVGGMSKDEFELSGEYVYFLRKLAKSLSTHLLPVWAQGCPPYKTSRPHVHSVLLAQKPINGAVWATAASRAKPVPFDFKRFKNEWFGEHYPKREEGEPISIYRRREQRHEDLYDIEVKKQRKLKDTHFGNSQSWKPLSKSFEPYDVSKGGISYILHKHVQWTSRVFCSRVRSCRNHGCKYHFPFQQLNTEEQDSRIIKTLRSAVSKTDLTTGTK